MKEIHRTIHPTSVLPVRRAPQRTELEAVRFVRSLGIRPNLSGYRFLICAVRLVLCDPSLLSALTRRLYPAVARIFRVNPAAVERGIRSAIESAYENDPQRVRNLFYYKVGKPYISEVLALAAESLIRQ